MKSRIGSMLFVFAALLACEGRSAKRAAPPGEEGAILVRVHGLDEASVDRVVVEFEAVSAHAVDQVHTIQRQSDNTFNTRVSGIEAGDYKVVARAWSGPDLAFWSEEILFTVVPNIASTLEIFLLQDLESDLVKTPFFLAVSFEAPPVVQEAVGIQVWGTGGAPPLALSGSGDGSFANVSGDPADSAGGRIEWTPSGPQPGTKTLTLTLTDADGNSGNLTIDMYADHQLGDVDFLVHFNHAPDIAVLAAVTHYAGEGEVELLATYTDRDSGSGSYLVDVAWDFSACTGANALVLTDGAAFLNEQVDVQSPVQRSFRFVLADASQAFQCTAEVTLADANPGVAPSTRKASVQLNLHEIQAVVPCKAGWGNCDGDHANGCETDLTSSDLHCGACNNPCDAAPPNAIGGGCVDSACTIASCAPGWGDCDNDWDNGCEASLDTELNCGACGNVCPLGCDNGSCVGFSSMGLGGESSCGVTELGALWCWGSNTSYQLGNPTSSNNMAPFEHTAPTDARQVAIGIGHGCAVDGAGALWCWGNRQYGRLGDGSSTGRQTPPAKISAVPVQVSQVAVGSRHSCVLDTNGEVWCWGGKNAGQIGDGTSHNSDLQLTPKKIATLTGVTQLRGTGDYNCAVTAAGEVYCWGTIGFSVGDFYRMRTPTRIAGPLNDKIVTDIGTGSGHVCARTDEGLLYCWGDNERGELGTGAPNPNGSGTPVQVLAVSDVVGVAAGDQTTCAIAGSGTVWCWGEQAGGRLGNGESASASVATPVEIAAPPNAQRIDSGGAHSCLLTTAGELWCWGANLRGQLGNGTTTDILVPTKIEFP